MARLREARIREALMITNAYRLRDAAAAGFRDALL
jgi:hypothetical protein